METIAKKEKINPFLREHPAVQQRVLLTSGAEEETLLAGSVIGSVEDKDGVFQGLYGTKADMTPLGILAADTIVPAAGNAWGVIYVHCAALASGLIWADGVSSDTQSQAITAMRGIGIYVE